MQQHDAELAHTAQTAAELHASGLLAPIEVTLRVAGSPVQLEGLLRVDHAALGRLPDAELASLLRSGLMRRLCAHLLALHRFNARARS